MTKRNHLLNEWLTKHFQTSHFTIKPASADASFRSYYRVMHNNKSFIVMDAPPEHEDCKPFIKTTRLLQTSHINVPIIIANNEAQGFLLLTDLGDTHYLSAISDDNADQLYRFAIDSLITFQLQANSDSLPHYDDELLQNEMRLFDEWLLESFLEISLTENDKEELKTVYKTLINNAIKQPQVFVHRDYHSRNLMVTERNLPGVLDHQDAVKGPITYDLVSLLKDSYIYWPDEKRDKWIHYYIEKITHLQPKLAIEYDQFKTWFDLMGVQRELKVAGIFTRLLLRDNKSAYLKDIPLTLNYILELNDSYPELNWLINFISDQVMPILEKKL